MPRPAFALWPPPRLVAPAASPAPLTVAPGLAVDADRLADWTAQFAHPGERVALDRSVRFTLETDEDVAARQALLGDRALVVSKTEVVPHPDGNGVLVQHAFQGIAGRFNARCFTDPRGYEHLFGMLIERDGQAWFVPLDSNPGQLEPAGVARRVRPVMDRAARHGIGVDDPAAFLAAHEAEPGTGEWVLFPNADGSRDIAGCPWASSASAEEVAVAEGAIAAALGVEAPGPRP